MSALLDKLTLQKLTLPKSALTKLRADAAGDSDTSLKWNKLFPFGTYYRPEWPGGKVELTYSYLAAIKRNFEKSGGPKRPIDYFHRGGSDVPVPNKEKLASGWIHKLEIRADGMWGLCSFTAAARAAIQAEELQYFSPEWRPDWIDSATGLRQGPTLLGGGLLNDPFFEGMPRVTASSAPLTHKPNPAPAAKEKKHMNPKLLALLKKYGITDTSSEAEIDAALAKEDSLKASASNSVTDALKLSLEAQKTKSDALEQELAKMKASAAALETESKVTTALASPDLLVRVTTPALKDVFRKMAASAGLDAAVAAAKDLPVQVELGEVGHAKPGPSKDSKDSAMKKLSASVTEIMRTEKVPESQAWKFALERTPDLADLVGPPVLDSSKAS